MEGCRGVCPALARREAIEKIDSDKKRPRPDFPPGVVGELDHGREAAASRATFDAG